MNPTAVKFRRKSFSISNESAAETSAASQLLLPTLSQERTAELLSSLRGEEMEERTLLRRGNDSTNAVVSFCSERNGVEFD